MNDEALAEYLDKQAASRASRTATFLASLTERERRLMREAAVMGWIQGQRHANLAIPKDSAIVEIVTTAALSMPDLYPVHALLAQSPSAGRER